MPKVQISPPKVTTTYPHGRKYAAVKKRVTYEIQTHSSFKRCLERPCPYVASNASLVKVTELLRGDKWVVTTRAPMKFSLGRGQGRARARKKRNPRRIDVRVNGPSAWRGMFWHRLLAFFFHNPDGLTLKEFKAKEVDHTNKTFRRIDWRRLRICDYPQGGL